MAKGKYTGVYKNGDKCRIEYKINKKFYRQTTDFKWTQEGQTQAYRLRKKLIQETRSGENLDGCTLEELHYKVIDSTQGQDQIEKTSIFEKFWLPLFGARQIKTLKYSEILKEAQKIKNTKTQRKTLRSNSTMKNILTPLSLAYEIAIVDGHIYHNPIPAIKKKFPKARPTKEQFTLAERDQILELLKSKCRHWGAWLFYTIGFYSGMRPAEIAALTWEDYTKNNQGQFVFKINKHFDRVKGTIAYTKTNSSREILVHPAIVNAIAEIPYQGIGKMRLIHYMKDKPITDYGSQIAKKFITQQKKVVGERKIRPYNYRHTCASMMLDEGLEHGYIAKHLGHDIQTFYKVYADFINIDYKTQHELYSKMK